ncbi:hypothetical protein PR202_ga07200 [Eleusine coracana subsp. coracana]|uniref:Uncharacterized protein n=1 Tax=Eleusine coracana subsp. coracana TaxID=191504 RepID=A0AAV5BZB8_ELECO|nr:hypothetical protein PR202_ga07200 [Eleusine coracana subsp. coracana]
MFRDGGEKWPVVIPEEELAMSYPGIKVRAFSYSVLSFHHFVEHPECVGGSC